MTEEPGKYTTPISEAMTFKVLSVNLPLPTEITEHIESQPNKATWLCKAIARQVEEDLKMQVKEAH